MQTDNRLFDDLARVATNAIGSLQTARDEASSRIRQQFERILETMDLVSREEFDTVKAMAQKARLENERLAKRATDLEARLGTAAAKPASRSSSASTPAGKTARAATPPKRAKAKAVKPKNSARGTAKAAKTPTTSRAKK